MEYIQWFIDTHKTDSDVIESLMCGIAMFLVCVVLPTAGYFECRRQDKAMKECLEEENRHKDDFIV